MQGKRIGKFSKEKLPTPLGFGLKLKCIELLFVYAKTRICKN